MYICIYAFVQQTPGKPTLNVVWRPNNAQTTWCKENNIWGAANSEPEDVVLANRHATILGQPRRQNRRTQNCSQNHQTWNYMKTATAMNSWRTPTCQRTCQRKPHPNTKSCKQHCSIVYVRYASIAENTTSLGTNRKLCQSLWCRQLRNYVKGQTLPSVLNGHSSNTIIKFTTRISSWKTQRHFNITVSDKCKTTI